MVLIDKDSLKANIIKRLGIGGEEYLLPAEKVIWNAINEEPPANGDLIQKIEEGIKATGTADEYSVGMCNGMKWCKSLLDGKAPEYDIVQPKYKKRRR